MQKLVDSLVSETTAKKYLSGDGTAAIKVENLVKRFGGTEALSRVSVTIRKGEFFSLLGPSGCGKTTLLRIIAGLELPDEGTLFIGNRDAASIPAHQRPVNTVFQSYALFPHLTVRENVAFGLRMKKVVPKEIKRRVDAMMEIVQITPFAERKPDQLSGGQRQRAALARALVNEPEVLLLDEPLGALDLKLRKELQLELLRLQRQLGTTFIFVTHDQEEALVISDRIAVMNTGRIEQLDTAVELYERPLTAFVAKFLGNCNLIGGMVKKSSTTTILNSLIGELQFVPANGHRTVVDGEKATLAVRPEKLKLNHAPDKDASNSFTATIEEIIYGGAETHYRVMTNGTSLSICALNSHTGQPRFSVGQTVILHIPAEALVVLK